MHPFLLDLGKAVSHFSAKKMYQDYQRKLVFYLQLTKAFPSGVHQSNDE